MKNRLYKPTAILLTLILLITSFPFAASAADKESEPVGTTSGITGDCTWTLNGDGVLTISGNGRMGDYVWHDIGIFLRWENWDIRSVIIENGVENIGDSAFYGSSLSNISIPDSVTSIGDGAFEYCCNLTSISIPDSVTSIGDGAFYDCDSLTSVTIGNSVKSIGRYAFYDCSHLSNLEIPDSVTNIGWAAFRNTFLCGDIIDDIEYFGKVAYQYTGSKDEVTSVAIKEGTKGIAVRAFAECKSLTTVTIPEGVEIIGEEAFDDCEKLKNINIPDGVRFIGGYAFCGCDNLTDVILPDSIETIGHYAFASSGLQNITIPDNVTSIGDQAFYGTEWYDNLPNEVIYLGKVLYEYKGHNSLNTSIIVKSGTIEIAPFAFANCGNLIRVTIPDSVKRIGNGAFNNCRSLTSIGNPPGTFGNTLPDCLSEIGESAFSGTGLTKITIPGSVKTIGAYAFASSQLTSVIIKDGVQKIGGGAFSNCRQLKKVSIPDSVTSIEGGAFRDCDVLENINIPDRVTCISSDMFADCYSLPRIEFGKNTFDIGSYAFSNCANLKSINIPDSIKNIGENAFQNCTGLTKISFGKNINNIEGGAFLGCTGLTSVIIPDSVTYISYMAFNGCTNLKSVFIGKGVEAIGECAFGVTGLKGVSIPNSVKVIGSGAFWHCKALTSVIISNGIEGIYRDAFFDCPNLHDAYYYGSEEDWSEINFESSGNDDLLNALRFNSSAKINVLGEIFSHDLKYFAKSQDSTQYNPELAHLMMTFANAAYSSEDVRCAYNQLGMSDCKQYHYDDDWETYENVRACYNIGSVKDDSGNISVLVSIRGSGNIADLRTGTLDWIGNFDWNSVTDTEGGPHEDFNNSMQKIYADLDEYLNQKYDKHIRDDDKHIRFFITSHSRGAAIAQLLELNIIDAMVYNGRKNVYGYNFAVPDTCIVDYDFNVRMFENIFNVSNLKDIVSYLPGFTVDFMTSIPKYLNTGAIDTRWRKWGVSVWYEDGTDEEISGAGHDPERYLSFLRLRKPIDDYTEDPKIYIDANYYPFAYDKVQFKVYATYCPVDVELVDKNGKVIASVINGVVEYDELHYGDIIVTTDGDHKMFAVPLDSNYTLRISGSDTGTMDYYVAETNAITEEVMHIKHFKSVGIESGKEMTSEGVDYLDTSDTQLFLVDKDNNKTREILTTGAEVNPVFFSESKLILKPDDTVTLTAESKDQYCWYSTDESIATVEDGVVTVHAFGEASIIAETENGARAICKVMVPANCGDVNLDGIITISDVTYIRRCVAEMVDFNNVQLAAADTNGDGKVDINDATHLQRYLAEYDVVLGKQNGTR